MSGILCCAYFSVIFKPRLCVIASSYCIIYSTYASFDSLPSDCPCYYISCGSEVHLACYPAIECWSETLITHLHLVQTLRVHGPILPISHMLPCCGA